MSEEKRKEFLTKLASLLDEYTKNEQEAKEIIEKQLKNGLEIIKVKLMEE